MNLAWSDPNRSKEVEILVHPSQISRVKIVSSIWNKEDAIYVLPNGLTVNEEIRLREAKISELTKKIEWLERAKYHVTSNVKLFYRMVKR